MLIFGLVASGGFWPGGGPTSIHLILLTLSVAILGVFSFFKALCVVIAIGGALAIEDDDLPWTNGLREKIDRLCMIYFENTSARFAHFPDTSGGFKHSAQVELCVTRTSHEKVELGEHRDSIPAQLNPLLHHNNLHTYQTQDKHSHQHTSHSPRESFDHSADFSGRVSMEAQEHTNYQPHLQPGNLHLQTRLFEQGHGLSGPQSLQIRHSGPGMPAKKKRIIVLQNSDQHKHQQNQHRPHA